MNKNQTIKLRCCLGILCLLIFLFPVQAKKIPESKKHNSGETINIDLYSAYKKSKTYQLSTIVESVEYIPLETTEECLLGESLTNIYIDDDVIIVFDYEYCYHFSREGKFINKIGKKGRGPGEYNRPVNISVEPTTKSIYILDIDKLLKYDYSGGFIKKFDLDVSAMRILKYKQGIFLINDMYYQYADPGKRFSIRFFSEQEEKQIAQVACPKKDKIPFSIDHPVMYQFNQNTFLKDYWDNTVYRVEDPLNLIAYASINTGRLKFREKDDNSVFTGEENPGEELVLSITYMSESERYIFMLANKGLFFYDKTSGETKCCEFNQTGEKWYNYKNDLTRGPTLYTSSLFTNSVDNNTFITYNHAYEFFEEGIETNNQQIGELVKNLQPDDNPVLVLVKLKK